MILRSIGLATLLAVVLSAHVSAQSYSPAVVPNGPYRTGANAVVVAGAAPAPYISALIASDSRRRVVSLWVLYDGRWLYYLPSLPTVRGGLDSFPGPVYSAIAVLA
jgi:hypothetical protein